MNPTLEHLSGRIETAPNRLRKQSPGPDPQIGTSDWRAAMQSISKRPTDEERFWARVSPTGFCWEWTGATSSQGYGRVHWGDRVVHAHRISFELLVGPIPRGLVIDHLCRNHACVNPDHLEPVTQRENNYRGRGITAAHARKTHCPKGHPYDEENTYMWSGNRHCRECHRIKDRLRKGRRGPGAVTSARAALREGGNGNG